MAKRTGLGKGLSSLIPAGSPAQKKVAVADSAEAIIKNLAVDTAGQVVVQELPAEAIVPNPMQPRKVFAPQELEELVASIKEHGVLQPITVTQVAPGKYELIAGERRLRSSKIAGKKTIPAIVREAGELEKLELALIENIQRQDLNPIEKAHSYQQLLHEFGLTQEQGAKRLGIRRSTLANTLRLLSLPAEIQKALSDNKLTAGHARALLALENPKQQLQLFHKIINLGMNVREAEAHAKQARHKPVRAADPNIEDKKRRLQSALGTKVDIKKSPKNGGGQIMINYYSAEELQDLIERLT
jgi:ParB family chromosome partitioning protein